MVALTDEAVETIRAVAENGGVGPNGGLRISGSTDNGGNALEFELVDEALAGDEVVRDGDVVVFLDRTAAEALHGKTLDVQAHGDHFHFSLD